MLIFTTSEAIEAHLGSIRKQGKRIGFVPTMGALHKGHISLVDQCLADNNYTVCSIFVNPTQFNDKSDLDNYPRTPEKDLKMLEDAGCHAVFMPSVKEIYPQEDKRTFQFGHLDQLLEGAHRPGHFNGVAKVVSILFKIIDPDTAYFGSKDYQQVMIIQSLVDQLNLRVKIIPCAIIREADGLAMSSRNMRLSAEERKSAVLIPKLLNDALAMKKKANTVASIKAYIEGELKKNEIYTLDYFEICDPNTLQPLNELNPDTEAIALIACFVGKIRLIDNLKI